jgi:hypothetical protein
MDIAMSDSTNIEELFAQLSDKFFALRQQRMHLIDEDATLDFLGEDVIAQMMNSLADLANMCDMQFIKLALLQDYLTSDLEKKEVADGSNIGLESFKKSSDVWKDNQR